MNLNNLTDEEFDTYMHRLKEYNEYIRDTAYTNGYYGYSEKQWVNDEDGGPPVPAMSLYLKIHTGWSRIISSLSIWENCR